MSRQAIEQFLAECDEGNSLWPISDHFNLGRAALWYACENEELPENDEACLSFLRAVAGFIVNDLPLCDRLADLGPEPTEDDYARAFCPDEE